MGLFLLVFFLYCHGMETSFQAISQGEKRDKSFLLAESEYQASKNTTYCRGHLVPFAADKWQCKEKGKKIKCKRDYKCKRASQDINRKRLSLVAKRKLKKTAKAKFDYHIAFMELKKKEKTVNKSAKKKIKKTISLQEKMIAEKDREKGEDTTTSREKQYKQESEETLRLVPLPEEVSSAKGKKVGKNNYYVEDSPHKQVEEIETDWVAKGKISPDGVPVYGKVVDRKTVRDQDHIAVTHGRLKSFVFSCIKVSNDSGEFLTYDGSWTPYFQFSDKYAVRANLGSHFIRVTSIYRDITFLVLSWELHGMYFFENRFFLEVGGGRQFWQNDENDSYDIFILGGGYKFRTHIFWAVDRIFASIGLLQNEEDNLELKLGMGLSF